MNPAELGFTLLLAAVLLGLAGYFGWRQVQALRGLAAPGALGGDDPRYLRSQAYRRLVCSGVMVLFAGLLTGLLLFDEPYRQIQEERQATEASGQSAPVTPEQQDFLRLFYVYMVVTMLVLLVLVALAGVDFWAIARYGLKQQRRLQSDERALLEEFAARHRRERNGSR